MISVEAKSLLLCRGPADPQRGSEAEREKERADADSIRQNRAKAPTTLPFEYLNIKESF